MKLFDKQIKSTTPVIIVWQVNVFEYEFDSPHVKQELISGITNFVYELCHNLPNNLRIRLLGN